MVFDFFKGTSSSTVEEVETKIVQMLRDGHAVYDAAMSAVFGGGKSKETKREVKSTDRGINQAQRDVRKAIMMHVSVVGMIDLPLMLAYMSIVKDAERVGDYAKNIYDIARYGTTFEAAPDREQLEHYRDAVGQLIDDAANVLEKKDVDHARALIDKADGFLDEYDDNIRVAYASTGPASEAVARALYYRYLKRITAHVMNTMTSLVLPIDQLDYYDEVKDDRD